jgi:hypothetical protein
MPFTPSHVAAVLPGVRWLRLDPTCLVIGSMAPDFEYFARGAQSGAFAHTWLGLAVFGLPVTIALALLYHHVVKWPALLALPAMLAPVFGVDWRPRWSIGGVAVLLASAAIGNVTHVLWDGLTHANGLFVHAFPVLRTPYELPVIGTIVLHRILQHVSSLVGLAVLGGYLWMRIRARRRRVPAQPRMRVRVVFALCIVIGGSLTLARLMQYRRRDPGSLVAGTISGMLAGTIAASLAMRTAGRRYARDIEDAK